MKPYALLLNDIHISRDNIQEFIKNWDEALQICDNLKISRIFLGGDLFEATNVQSLTPMLTVMECFKKLADKGVKLYLVSGNHDRPDKEVSDSWCDLYSCIENVHVYKHPAIVDMGECTLVMVPYILEDKYLPGVIDNIRESLKDKDIIENTVLYLHAGIKGALGEFDVPNEIDPAIVSDFHSVLCGHYHNRIHIKNTNVQYIGSSRAHSFGEDENKGYTVLYPDGSTKFIQNSVNIRFVTEDIPFDEVDSWNRGYDNLYKVRLRIYCTTAQADLIDRDSLIKRGANKIEFVTEKIQAIKAEASKIDEKFDSKNIQKEYQNFCNEKDLDSTLGIEYLNKI